MSYICGLRPAEYEVKFMKFKIVTDSSANLQSLGEGVDFQSVPLTIRVENREFVDDEKLDLNDMLETLATT